MSKRGRPRGAISRASYFKLLKETNTPKEYKKAIKDFVDKEVKKLGRHPAKPESLKILSGRITVKASSIRAGSHEYRV
jgi:hypothetical protein